MLTRESMLRREDEACPDDGAEDATSATPDTAIDLAVQSLDLAGQDVLLDFLQLGLLFCCAVADHDVGRGRAHGETERLVAGLPGPRDSLVDRVLHLETDAGHRIAD